MEAQFTTLGAIVGLIIAIIMIIKKVQPAYSLILGALIGGLIGGGGLSNTVSTMVSGAGSMMSSVLRILRNSGGRPDQDGVRGEDRGDDRREVG